MVYFSKQYMFDCELDLIINPIAKDILPNTYTNMFYRNIDGLEDYLLERNSYNDLKPNQLYIFQNDNYRVCNFVFKNNTLIGKCYTENYFYNMGIKIVDYMKQNQLKTCGIAKISYIFIGCNFFWLIKNFASLFYEEDFIIFARKEMKFKEITLPKKIIYHEKQKEKNHLIR